MGEVISMTDKLIESLRAALNPSADVAARQRGVEACRSLLAALAATPGQPLVPPPPRPPVASPLASAAIALASAPPSTVLDTIITRLRAKLPEEEPKREQRHGPIRLDIPFVPIKGIG